MVTRHEFTPYGTPPRRAEFLLEPHSAFFLSWLQLEGVNHYLMSFSPSNATTLLTPHRTFFQQKALCLWCFYLLNIILLCSVLCAVVCDGSTSTILFFCLFLSKSVNINNCLRVSIPLSDIAIYKMFERIYQLFCSFRLPDKKIIYSGAIENMKAFI